MASTYRANIEVIAKGLQSVDRLAKSVKKLNKIVQQSNKLKESKTDRYSQQLKRQNNLLKTQIADQRQLNSLLEQESKLRRSSAKAAQANRPRGGGGLGGGGGRVSQAILGGGFPLLFGGGPAQALGGLVGGAAGGFAGGIAGQIIVGQFEAIGRAAADLGNALDPLTFDLEAVSTAAGVAGTETAQFLEKIEKYGSVTEAARLATALLETKIGKDGVKALKDFGNSATDLGNALSTIFTQVLANIAKVAGPLLERLARFAGEQADVGAFLERTGLTGQEKLAQEILGTGFQRSKGELTTASARALSGFSARSKELGGQGFQTAEQARAFATEIASGSQRKLEIPVLQEIESVAAGIQTPEDKRAANAAEKEQRKSEQLSIKVDLKERLLALDTQIAKAVLDGDKANQALLEKEKVRETLAAKIDTIKTKGLSAELEAKEIEVARVDAAQKIQDITAATAKEKADEAKKAQDVLDGLLQEQALLQATLDGRKEEEQIKQRLAEIMDKNPTLAEAEVKAILEGNQALREKITLQQQQEQLYARIGQTISSGIVNGIQSAIDGSKSLKESLSGILKSLAGIFLQAGIGSFGVGGQAGSGLLGLLKFSEGGYVSGPTPSLVGEGGEPEYIIPESKMRESMSRYSRGARGSAVIPEAGGSGASGEGGGTAVAAPIDVRYSVARINSVDYVTADQFQAGMRQAATQGAKQGEQQTLRRLQMSGSTRKRVGM